MKYAPLARWAAAAGVAALTPEVIGTLCSNGITTLDVLITVVRLDRAGLMDMLVAESGLQLEAAEGLCEEVRRAAAEL